MGTAEREDTGIGFTRQLVHIAGRAAVLLCRAHLLTHIHTDACAHTDMYTWRHARTEAHTHTEGLSVGVQMLRRLFVTTTNVVMIV